VTNELQQFQRAVVVVDDHDMAIGDAAQAVLSVDERDQPRGQSVVMAPAFEPRAVRRDHH
jgi:hypothetical protein